MEQLLTQLCQKTPHSQNSHGFTPTIPWGGRWHVAMAACFDHSHEHTEATMLAQAEHV